MVQMKCPCGTDKAFVICCGAYIANEKIPSTPEELMRSRYVAYHQADFDYIMQTMKSPAADQFDLADARKWAKKIKWTGLEVLNASHNADKGTVEFVASYSIDGKKYKLHEKSEFSFEGERWYYVDGVQFD